jgi:hypothetical protein
MQKNVKHFSEGSGHFGTVSTMSSKKKGRGRGSYNTNKPALSKAQRNETKNMVKSILSSKQVNLKKFIDTSTAYTFLVGSADNFVTFGMPTSAVGASGRVGDSINLDKIDFRFNALIQEPLADNTSAVIMRLIVFQFIGEYPGAFVPTELLQSSSNQQIACSSPLNYDNNGKFFHVLFDEVIVMSGGANRTFDTGVICLKPKISKLRYDNGVPIWTSGQPAFALFPLLIGTGVTTSVITEAMTRLWFYDV